MPREPARTTWELIDMLKQKLARRRYLNQPEMAKARGSIGLQVKSISIRFEEAEAIIKILRGQQ